MWHRLRGIAARLSGAERAALIAGTFSIVALVVVGVMLAEPAPSERRDAPRPSISDDDVSRRQRCHDLYLDPERTDIAGDRLPADEDGWLTCINL